MDSNPVKQFRDLEQDETAKRVLILVVLHGLINLVSMILILGFGTKEFGPLTFLATTLLTFITFYSYSTQIRRCSINELLLLELLVVDIGVTLAFSYVINKLVRLFIV